MEEERRARTIGVNTTQQQYSTKEDEETMRRLREQLVDAQMRHDETAKVVLHLQEDVERIQREKEDLRVKSAKIWQEQQDALAAKETERKTREEEGEAREKARETEVANLVAKVNQLERERAKEKEMKAESDVKVDVGKFEEEIADLRKKLEAERGKVVAAEKSVAEEKAKTEKVLADASVAASVAVTPTSSEEEKSEEEALKKEIESVKTENEKLKAEIETIRASESKLREENQTLQSIASTSTQDKSASESEHKKNMDALTLELSAVQSKLSSEIESNKKALEDARKQLENERASAKKSVDDTIMKSENHVAELDKEISNLKAQLDLSNVEKTETTEKFELLLATRDEEVKSLEKNIKDALAEMQSIRNELNVAKEAVQVANETSKAALNGAEDAEKAREETKEEMKALQLKLDHAEEALKNTQISAPNLERQIAEKNALKSTLADVRYERDVLANMLKDMKKKVGAYSMETPPILRAVNDAKKNLNGFMSRFQGTGSTSTVKKNTTTTQAPASASASKNPNTKSPSAAATPQKLNFSQPAAALTPP
jgi:chromosome segregation ATPase